MRDYTQVVSVQERAQRCKETNQKLHSQSIPCVDRGDSPYLVILWRERHLQFCSDSKILEISAARARSRPVAAFYITETTAGCPALCTNITWRAPKLGSTIALHLPQTWSKKRGSTSHYALIHSTARQYPCHRMLRTEASKRSVDPPPTSSSRHAPKMLFTHNYHVPFLYRRHLTGGRLLGVHG